MTPLLSIAYLPPQSYIASCLHSGKIIIDRHEHYVKQTYRNRTHIYSANGLLPLIIPVQHKNLFTIPIEEVKIDYSSPWQKIHWRSITSSYRNSAFFEYFEDALQPVYEKKFPTLFQHNHFLTEKIFQLLGAKVDITYTGSYEKESKGTEKDMRNYYHPKNKEPFENRYRQVFSDRHSFINNLSIIDLLFNEGKESISYLLKTFPQKDR